MLLGVLVGAILGLTGAGGSIFAVPLLMAGAGLTLPQAAPVALMAVCGAAAFGTLVAWDATFVRYRAAILMALAGWFTAPLGLAVAADMPMPWLVGVFALVLVLVSLKLIAQAIRSPDSAGIVRASVKGDGSRSTGRWVSLDADGRIIWTVAAISAISAIGAVTGFLAGLLGVGGGFVIVPALRYVSALSMHSAIATSLMGIALTSAGTVVAAILQGQQLPWGLALPFLLGALGGMWIGRRLAPRVAGARLQQGFAVMMFLVGCGMGGRALGLF